MEKTRQIALFCVGRAIAFGWLAIGCIMFSLAFNPVLAFRAGAVLAMVMAAILIFKALAAARQNPKHTEVWIYLDDGSKPRNDEARLVFATMMREVYARYAQGVFVLGCVFFGLSVAFVALGYEPVLPIQPRVEHPG